MIHFVMKTKTRCHANMESGKDENFAFQGYTIVEQPTVLILAKNFNVDLVIYEKKRIAKEGIYFTSIDIV